MCFTPSQDSHDVPLGVLGTTRIPAARRSSRSRIVRCTKVILSLIPLLLAGCSDPRPEPESSPTVDTYMAISGGGWRTHTAQAAWTMGLLAAYRAESPPSQSVDLGTVLGPVNGISSNSGGSWFTTMLFYSGDFVNAIEDPAAVTNWGTTGYLYQQQAMLGGSWNSECGLLTCEPCSTHAEGFLCKLKSLTGHPLIWTDTVNEVVFKPFAGLDDLSSIPLSGTRQTWAQDKSLILAATMVTDTVVLTESGGDELYYQATPLNPTAPAQVSVTPVTFTSLPSGLAAPDFFLAGDMQLEYMSNASSPPPSVGQTISNSDVDSDVLVLAAAAASSAAGGAEASHDVLVHQGHTDTPWSEAYGLSELAPAFWFDQSPIVQQPVPDDCTDLTCLSGKKIVRLADGGFLDNSGVAHLINFLQKNKKATNFNIIAFDNVQETYPSLSPPPPSGTLLVPIDIAYLFGVGRSDNTEYCAEANDPSTCVEVPISTIFDPDGLKTGTNLWTYPCPGGDSSNQLTYSQYTVETVENQTLGITAGSTGTLHVFASIWPLASTAPENGDADFTEYNNLLQCIYTGMTQGPHNGTTYFRKALASP